MTITLRVPDASCGHCKSTIESALTRLPGVTAADLDLATKELVVSHDEAVTREQLEGAITAAGYTPEPAA